MRSSICALPGLPTRSAKASNVICVGLPSRISTIVPPGSVGALIAAASRFDMPSNIAWIGASTACSSADWAKAGVTRIVARIVLNKKMPCFPCLYMFAILPCDQCRENLNDRAERCSIEYRLSFPVILRSRKFYAPIIHLGGRMNLMEKIEFKVQQNGRPVETLALSSVKLV